MNTVPFSYLIYALLFKHWSEAGQLASNRLIVYVPDEAKTLVEIVSQYDRYFNARQHASWMTTVLSELKSVVSFCIDDAEDHVKAIKNLLDEEEA